MIRDVRSGGFLPQERISGAVPAPLNGSIVQAAEGLLPGAVLVAYCDCPNDASASRAAQALAKLGHPGYVLGGGFPAWAAAGLPVMTFDEPELEATARPREHLELGCAGC